MNEQQLLTEIKKLEGVYLKPQNFKQYKNYWLPENIVRDNEGEEEIGKNANIKENSEPTEVKEHPLIDLAINDYKGKIIK